MPEIAHTKDPTLKWSQDGLTLEWSHVNGSTFPEKWSLVLGLGMVTSLYIMPKRIFELDRCVVVYNNSTFN